MSEPSTSKSWSIYTRREVTAKYQIIELVGSGAFSDVYKGRRLSDDLIVALKEVHDSQSALREIEALQTLQHCPNVVALLDYFWSDDEDAVIVLEFLPHDLSNLVRAAAKGEWRDQGLRIGEIKRWMIQILSGVDACHRNSIVHRDLKPTNLLISTDGVLKLADFGQARVLLAPGFVAADSLPPDVARSRVDTSVSKPPESSVMLGNGNEHEGPSNEDFVDNADKEGSVLASDGDVSCLATCTASEMEEDPFSVYSVEGEDCENQGLGPLTSCVGTRWFRAPELLLGSTTYGPEVDLWSLGCIFAELLSLEPLFPGNSDIDQIRRIFSVLGNLTEEIWPGCSNLTEYQILSFAKVENPVGLEARLPNRSPDEILLIKKLLSFDPTNRAESMELLQDKYLNEEPLPVPISKLRVPSKPSDLDDDSTNEWGDCSKDSDSDSDFDCVCLEGQSV